MEFAIIPDNTDFLWWIVLELFDGGFKDKLLLPLAIRWVWH
jgi:hypothetical protein